MYRTWTCSISNSFETLFERTERKIKESLENFKKSPMFFPRTERNEQKCIGLELVPFQIALKLCSNEQTERTEQKI